MNKILKKTIAFAAIMCFGLATANAKTMNAEDIKAISQFTSSEGNGYHNVYIRGNYVFFEKITLADILETIDCTDTDKVLYFKDGENNWFNEADGHESLGTVNKIFEMTHLVGTPVGSNNNHVSEVTKYYENEEVTNKEYGIDSTRRVDIFEEIAAPYVSLDISKFASAIQTQFNFVDTEAYGSTGLTIDKDNKISGLLKLDNKVNEKFGETGKGYYFAYVLNVPGADENTTVTLRSKSLSAADGSLVWDAETDDEKSLWVVVGLDSKAELASYEITVNVGGYDKTVTLDLSGLRFQQESKLEKVQFEDKAEGAYLEDLKYMKENWAYDYSLNNELVYTPGADNLFTVSGNITKIDVNNNAFDKNEDLTGYYFTYGLYFDTNYPNMTITTRGPHNPKTFTTNTSGVISVLHSVRPTDISACAATPENCRVVITVDFDGAADEYYPTVYTIDYSKVVLGNSSRMKLALADDQTYLYRDFGWETPEKYITIDPDATDTTKFYAKGTLSKYVGDISKAGFGEDATGYYLAFKISVLNDGNMRNNDDITIKVDNNGSQKTLTKANFDNAHDIYVLAQIDPAKVTDLTKRVIKYTIDLDGAKDEYAPQTYTLDWSTLGFSEDSRATLTIRNNDKLSYSQRKITGEIMETELNSGIYKFNLTVIPALNTTLNGHLTEIPEDIIVKIGNNTYTASDFKGSNSLVKEVELDSKATDKRIFVTIDLDGDGETFNPYTYPVSYSGVTFKYYTGVEARAPKDGEFTTENSFGLDISKIGKMEILNTKDENQKSIVYVRGYALETSIDTSAGYGRTNGYFLPISIDVANPTHLTEIKMTNDSSGSVRNYPVDSVDDSGLLTIIRLLSTDGQSFAGADNFTLTFTYDDETETEEEVKFDLSGVKFGYAAMYADAYEKTINSEYTHTEKTLFKFGSDDGQSEYPDLIDFMTILKPRNISGYSSYETSDSITSLKLQVNPGTINPIIKAIGLDGSGDYAGGGLFKSPVYFVVKIDANGYIISFDAECSSGVFNTHPQFKDSVSGKEYVMESMTMHYELHDHVAKNETKVEFDGGKTLETQATELKDQFYGTTSSDKTLSELTDPEFKKVYTKVGTVNNPSLTKIKIGDREYTNEPTYISVGGNKYLNVPVFVIIKDELWVSNVHLMAEYYPTVKVVYDDFTYEVPTSATEHTVEIDSVAAINASETNKVSGPVFDEASGRWVITHTSDSGNNMIGIKLKVDGVLISEPGQVIYRINDDAGDMGVTVSETKEGNVYAYTAYTSAYGKPVTKVSRNSTLIVPGKGIIKIRIDVVPVQ